MYCIFCNTTIKGNVDAKKDLVCPTCINNLLKFSQEELKGGQEIARKLGMYHKADVLQMFIEKEKRDGSKDNRLPNGSRGNRVSRIKKGKPTTKLAKKGKSAVHKGNKNGKNVFRSRSSKLAK